VWIEKKGEEKQWGENEQGLFLFLSLPLSSSLPRRLTERYRKTLFTSNRILSSADERRTKGKTEGEKEGRLHCSSNTYFSSSADSSPIHFTVK
jgi:hypothetical protein